MTSRSLRPEDIRVEAEFVDMVVTTAEGITSPASGRGRPPVGEVSRSILARNEAYLPQDPPKGRASAGRFSRASDRCSDRASAGRSEPSLAPWNRQ